MAFWEPYPSPTHPSRKISTNFPKRLELSFLTVLALPKDSKRGVASRIWGPEGEEGLRSSVCSRTDGGTSRHRLPQRSPC